MMDAFSNAELRYWWLTASSSCCLQRVAETEAGDTIQGWELHVKYVPPCSVDEIEGIKVSGGIVILMEGGTGTGEKTCGPAVGPSAQARDAASQEEEEKHADPNLRKVTMKRRKRGLHSSTKMDVYET
jgi:hypothetical protein